MAYGARRSLTAMVLCLALGIPATQAQPSSPGAAWTDPPARKAPPERPAAEVAPAASARAAEPAPPAVAVRERPTVTVQRARPAPVARRETPARRPVAAVPQRARLAAAPRERAAQARAPRAGGPRAYRPYGYPEGYGDDSLERLSAAQAAGYIVMRRGPAGGSVEFSDGRSLRVYVPAEAGNPF